MLFWLRLSFLQSCLTFWDSKFTSCPNRTTLGTTAFFLCNYCSAMFETKRIKWALECLMSITILTPSNTFRYFFIYSPHFGRCPSAISLISTVFFNRMKWSVGTVSPDIYKSFYFSSHSLENILSVKNFPLVENKLFFLKCAFIDLTTAHGKHPSKSD